MKNKAFIMMALMLISLVACKKETTKKDGILSALSTTKTAYQSATSGSWIEVTSAEYNNLASTLSNITRSGTSEADYQTVSTTSPGITNVNAWTIAQNDGNTLPTGSYLFAVKIKTATATNTGAKVKLSNTSVNAGFADVGSVLPPHAAGEHFFVLKGNATATTSTAYLGLFKPLGATIVVGPLTGKGNYSFETGDVNSLPSNFGGIVFLYQGLSTTNLQW